MERCVRAVHLTLRQDGDLPNDGASVWRVRVAALPAAWGLRARAQYRDLISARALLFYVRAMRLSVHPIRKSEAVRAAVERLRAAPSARVTGRGLDAGVRDEARALAVAVARPAAAAAATPPVPTLVLASGDPAAAPVFAPAVRRKRVRSEVN